MRQRGLYEVVLRHHTLQREENGGIPSDEASEKDPDVQLILQEVMTISEALAITRLINEQTNDTMAA